MVSSIERMTNVRLFHIKIFFAFNRIKFVFLLYNSKFAKLNIYTDEIMENQNASLISAKSQCRFKKKTERLVIHIEIYSLYARTCIVQCMWYKLFFN